MHVPSSAKLLFPGCVNIASHNVWQQQLQNYRNLGYKFSQALIALILNHRFGKKNFISNTCSYFRDPYLTDVLVSPSCRVCDEADDEEHPGEGLHGAADGEDGAADAAPAADGQQREQVSDQLKKNHIGGFSCYKDCSCAACSSNESPITLLLTMRPSPRTKAMMAPLQACGYLSSSRSVKRDLRSLGSGMHSPSKNFWPEGCVQWRKRPTVSAGN